MKSTYARRRTTPGLQVGAAEGGHARQTEVREAGKMLEQVVDRLDGDVLAVREMNALQRRAGKECVDCLVREVGDLQPSAQHHEGRLDVPEPGQFF